MHFDLVIDNSFQYLKHAQPLLLPENTMITWHVYKKLLNPFSYYSVSRQKLNQGGLSATHKLPRVRSSSVRYHRLGSNPILFWLAPRWEVGNLGFCQTQDPELE